MFKYHRWTLANILPVAFVLGTIAIIWSLYLWLHLLPLLRVDQQSGACVVAGVSNKSDSCAASAISRGLAEAIIQQALTVMCLTCFFKAVFTEPGSVPDALEWLGEGFNASRGPEEIGVKPEVSGTNVGPKLKQGIHPQPHEVKHTGARRFCKWCQKYKPDRSHHCRVCRSCILRMDHHCPWIANCVGFQNHKYFFLLVLYSLLDCIFVISTMTEAIYRALYEETHFLHRFLLVFAMTLAVIMSALLIVFSLFHSWLLIRATTTIEFCEKTYMHAGGSHRGAAKSIYARSLIDNIKAVLGEEVYLWFLPMSPPRGDGLSFPVGRELDDGCSDGETTALLSGHGRSEGSSNSFPMSSHQEASVQAAGEREEQELAEDAPATQPPKDAPEVTSASAAAA